MEAVSQLKLLFLSDSSLFQVDRKPTSTALHVPMGVMCVIPELAGVCGHPLVR